MSNSNEATNQASGAEDNQQAQAETRTKTRNERAPRGENRRNERPRHDDAAQADTSAALSSTESPQATGEAAADNNGERRERRSRDRYGRDRRERGGERTDRQTEGASQEQLGFDDQPASASTHRGHGASAASHSEASHTPSATSSTAAPRASMPKVQAFSLSLPELQAIAQNSGLEWVNSDAARIAAVQAAIAAEPKPVHVPRERPAPVVLDEGPLILVETRKELV